MPGASSGREKVSKRTYLAEPSGLANLTIAAREKPDHGTTMDQPSTQRCRYTRSSRGILASSASASMVNFFSTRPSKVMVQGLVVSFWAAFEIDLLVPNS